MNLIIPTTHDENIVTPLGLKGDVTYHLEAIGVDPSGSPWGKYRHGHEYTPGVPTRLYYACDHEDGFRVYEKDDLPSGIKWLTVKTKWPIETAPTTEEIEEVSEIETDDE